MQRVFIADFGFHRLSVLTRVHGLHRFFLIKKIRVIHGLLLPIAYCLLTQSTCIGQPLAIE